MQLILEGMGRSLHTNLNARFKCDALKVLVSANLTHLLLHRQTLIVLTARNFLILKKGIIDFIFRKFDG